MEIVDTIASSIKTAGIDQMYLVLRLAVGHQDDHSVDRVFNSYALFSTLLLSATENVTKPIGQLPR